MKKIINILGYILFVISIILIIIGLVLFIKGIFNSYNNGIEDFSLFGNNNTYYYGKEAINEYFSQSFFALGLLSYMGILPIIFLPIFVAILLKFKKSFSEKVTKYMIIALIISILLNIIIYKEYLFFSSLVFFYPFIESAILSYIIAGKFYNMNKQ